MKDLAVFESSNINTLETMKIQRKLCNLGTCERGTDRQFPSANERGLEKTRVLRTDTKLIHI